MSVSTRILLGFLLILSAGLFFLVAPLFYRVERQYLEAVEEPMVDEANLFATLIEQSANESGALDLTAIRRAFAEAQNRHFDARIYNFNKTSVNTNLYVTDRRGVVLFDSDGGKAEGKHYGLFRDVGYTLSGQYGARATLMPGGPNNYVMYVGAPIRRDGKIIGEVSVSKPILSMYAFISQTRARILWLGVAIFLVLAVGAAVITTLYSLPIQRLALYARAVARGERVKPPRVDSPEVAILARAFEEMRDALEGRKYVETYVQTMTHEMKSPVAAIRGAAELLREEVPPEQREKFLANIEAESHRLQRIIDRLLGLSAIESRKALEKPEFVSLADLAETIGDQLRPAAEARNLKIEITTTIRPVVTAESFLMEIAMTNLIQNALDFSPRGGVIRVAFAEVDEKRWVEMSVDDEGPGIPDYALPRLFERFYSLAHPSTGRKSSGLGLCFVREAVELHGGSVSIANRTDGPGAHAVLRLPINGPARKVV